MMTSGSRTHCATLALRVLRVAAFALLPLLYGPLRAAEPPRAPSRTEPPAQTPAADSTDDSTATTTPAADNDEDATEQEPLERVSADNNLSFPVDI